MTRLWNAFQHARWSLAKRLVPRRVVRSRGLSFTLQCDNWITHYRWASYNQKEPETLDWIDQQMRDGEIFFDVGANTGLYTIYAALRWPRSRVVAFEPEYANLHLLRDNILANKLQDRVAVYAVALSDQSGPSYLHLHDTTPGAALHTESRSSLDRTVFGGPPVWQEGVWTVTLDTFCAETHLYPSCMKVDVDGTEAKVLRGSAGILSAPAFGSLLLEVANDTAIHNACEALLSQANLQRVWQRSGEVGCTELWEAASSARGTGDESQQLIHKESDR